MVKTNYSGLNPVVVQALNNLQYRYSGETPEMWCSRVRYPFKKLLEYNSKYFSKNGFIQITERLFKDGEFKAGRRSFNIYCTVCGSLVIIRENTIECTNDHLNKCITKTAKRRIAHSNPVQKNTKKGGAPSRKRVASLSPGEIDKIYLTYSVMYSKGLTHYSYDYSHEGRKRIVNHLIDSAKVVQRAWRAFKLRPETWTKRVWNMVRNDSTPDKKKFLGINLSIKKTPNNYYIANNVDKKKEQLSKRLCLVSYIVAFILLHRQGYRIVEYLGWTYMLK
jgi:hypothetical protein